MVCGTGYTGEDGVELLLAPDGAPAVWDALLEGGAAPVGLGARDTLRLEVCFHLYGNDMDENRNPIEAGLGWCCKEGTGFIGSEAVAAVRADGPKEKLVPFVIEGPGIARQGNPVRDGGVVTSGTFSPCLERGIGMAYVSTRAGRARDPDRDRRPRAQSAGDHLQEALVPKGIVSMSEASYPDDLLYHAEHDWARVEGDEATFGITWYAQDALGEVVFFDPPKVGATIKKDEPYAEVESVKAVSDVIAPLSGEIVGRERVAVRTLPRRSTSSPMGMAGSCG